MNVLSLFDGISCGQLALKRAGIEYENYFASEIDQYATKITQNHFPDTIQLGDINQVNYKELPKIDLILAGSPCQGFSFAGNQLNFNDKRSSLYFKFLEVKNYFNCDYLFENVPMKKEFIDIINIDLDTKPILINSSLVSAQNRKRLYWSNKNIKLPLDLNIKLKDIIGNYEGIYVAPRGYNKGGQQSYNGKSPCVTISSWQYNFFVIQNGINRKFTINEVEQLQTLSVNYTEGVSDNKRFKLVGNGWTVDVIKNILKQMYNY